MQGRDKSHKGSWGDDVIDHCEGARDPAAMPGLNRKKRFWKKLWKNAPISSLGYGASKEKEIKKPRSLAKISEHFFTIFFKTFFFDSSQAWPQGHVLLHSDLWRHLPMILCETYPFPAHRKSRHLGLKTVSFFSIILRCNYANELRTMDSLRGDVRFCLARPHLGSGRNFSS